MPEKDPLSYQLITYVWVIGLSSWAAIASYVRKIRSGYRHFSITELIGEICVSGFVGIITFYLCESSEINPMLSAAFIGISAHMGSRAIYGFERCFELLIKRWININD